MHTQGVAHRDIKPENLLLSRDNELKITDFGLSTVVQRHPLLADPRVGKTMCGSAFYAAPEVWSVDISGPYDPFRADIWSCGIVLYAMLVGKPPVRVARAVCPMFRALNSDRFPFPKHLSKDVITVLKACLTIDPNERITANMLLKSKWLKDDRANEVPQKALDVLARTVIGDRTKWATHEELLREGWLGTPDAKDGPIKVGDNAPDYLKILRDASLAKQTSNSNQKVLQNEEKQIEVVDDKEERKEQVATPTVVEGPPRKRLKTNTETKSESVAGEHATEHGDLSYRAKKEHNVKKEKEYEPARQVAGLGWTGMMCARENARKRVQESLKSLGLVIVDVDDDDKKGRSEIVAVASTALTKAMASGANMAITKAMVADAYAEVGSLMTNEVVSMPRHIQQQQRLKLLLNGAKNGMKSELKNVLLHKDESPLVAKVTIYEEFPAKGGGDDNVKHTIHFNRGAGDMFAYHGLYKMIRSKLKDLNQGSF